jgi:hypothetical protein
MAIKIKNKEEERKVDIDGWWIILMMNMFSRYYNYDSMIIEERLILYTLKYIFIFLIFLQFILYLL